METTTRFFGNQMIVFWHDMVVTVCSLRDEIERAFAEAEETATRDEAEQYYEDEWKSEEALRYAESGAAYEDYLHGKAVMATTPYEDMMEELALQDFEARLAAGRGDEEEPLPEPDYDEWDDGRDFDEPYMREDDPDYFTNCDDEIPF